MQETNIKVLQGRNVNALYPMGLEYLKLNGVLEESRLGRVLVAPGPVVNIYERPRERVLFSPSRDANPFFHLMEALWMLAGEQAAAWPVSFNKQMAEYMNPLGNYDGAYGYRWRRMFGRDQIMDVVQELTDSPGSRRAVIAMWSPGTDLRADSKDIPCNTHMYFDIRHGKLNMTVCCRSNDAVWGCYGANAVHMSVLQEVIAGMLRVPVGVYRQYSNNFHAYVDNPKIAECLSTVSEDEVDYYSEATLNCFPLVGNPLKFLEDCEQFLRDPTMTNPRPNPFFYYVARPMYLAWQSHKARDYVNALSWAQQIEDVAWSMACEDWLIKREAAYEAG